MPGSQIIIFTEQDDLHADEVIKKLTALGHSPIRLNTEEIPSQTSIALRCARGRWEGGVTNRASGRAIHVDDIRSVWIRRPNDYRFPPEMPVFEQEFATEEIHHALNSMWYSLDCYWMSSLPALRLANWKGEQLKRAAALGFEVPRTLITTDPAAVREFYDACNGKMIFKSMSGPAAAAQAAKRSGRGALEKPIDLRTKLIRPEHLGLLETVRHAPAMFQEYVDKRVELRITVVGNELFAAEIQSQADPRTRIDYRDFDVDILYRKAQLPVEIAERCLKFVHSYGLNYSALDLILTPDGRYVFLENNPNGQYLFVEQLVPELPITAALTACLIRGANG